MSYFGYDSGNHLIYGTQNGKCFDGGGDCEHCGSSRGEEAFLCEGTGEVVYPETCAACKEECCCLRKPVFVCEDCGKVTRL